MEAALVALRSDALDFASVGGGGPVSDSSLGTVKSIQSLLMGLFIIVFVGGVAWLGFQVATHDYYEPGDDVGYNMGLVGGLMMLTLLSYPLRKHFAFMRRLGQMKYWFSMHMMLGIFGPLLVVFHSAFEIHSVNAAVALTSMLVVAGSGFIGRYAYRHIHRGLYGSKMTLHEIREELLGRKDEADSKLRNYPAVIFILHHFQHYALRKGIPFTAKVWRFFSLPLRRQVANFRCRMIVPGYTREDRELRGLVLDYLYGVERAAQFRVFERIFALWHVIHIPLVFMLVATAIWHVVAVHMY